MVAVSMDWLVGMMDTTAAAGKTLGVEIDEVSSTTVPQAGVIDVPCYREDAFNGRTARLAYEEKWVPFDFATLTERDHDLATAERGEEWTIQGVVAVSMDWLVGMMDTTAAAGKTLGVEIDEV
ncbi:hypothetical protein CTI14_49860, partial [Methylobacterium radiotolerans]